MHNEKGWIKTYEKAGALWIHDGNIKRPHALLTSGMHSNGFFNSKLVTENDELREGAAEDLTTLLILRQFDIHRIDRVVGPATGATKLAKSISEKITLARGRKCEWASPDKEGDGPTKKMVYTNPERKVLPSEHILDVEDVLTTGGSVHLTDEATLGCKGVPMDFILVLVNRSGFPNVNNKRVVALINRHMPIWLPEKCPQCEVGSEAIRPKQDDNWARLNATY